MQTNPNDPNSLLSNLTAGGLSDDTVLHLDDDNLDENGKPIVVDDEEELDENGNKIDKTDKSKAPKKNVDDDIVKRNKDILANLTKDVKGKDEKEKEDDDDLNDDKDKDKGGKDEKSALEVLAEEYGYVGEDYTKAFEGLDFKDNSVEGIKKFNEKRDPLVKAEGYTELYEALPPVQSLVEHLSAGKGVESWLQKQTTTDWSKYELTEDKPETAENLVKSFYKSQELTDRKVSLIVDDLKDNKELFTEAKDILTKLTERDKVAQAAIEAREVEATNKAKIAQAAVVKEITDIIKGGVIEGFTLPENERKGFASRVLSDERIKTYDKLSTGQSLLLDYLAEQMVAGKPLNLKGQVVKAAAAKKTFVVKKNNPMDGNEDVDADDSGGNYIGLDGLKLLRKQG